MAPTLQEEVLGTAEELAGLGCWTVQLATNEIKWSDGMYRLLGLEPRGATPSRDLLLRRVHPEDRQLVTDKLAHAFTDPAAFVGGTGLEYRVVRPDGSVRDVRGRGRARREEAGWRWFGIEQDVTDQRMSERELQAHYAVSQALREWESFEEGIVVLLRRMATALDFSSGALWTLDPKTGEVTCRAIYTEPDLGDTEWEASTRALRYRPGEGLPARVLKTGAPLVIPDVASDPDFRRGHVASSAGITSALVIPAIGPDGPVAILSFYSSERRDPSARLLRTLSGIGAELGRFLARRRGELEPSPLSARELEVLSLAAEGLSGPQIAERLIVSPSTIKTHFENIYEKLGIGDRAGAVAYALRIGLIS